MGYTDLCAQLQPYEVMDLMHRLYSQLDAIIQAMALFKVETGEEEEEEVGLVGEDGGWRMEVGLVREVVGEVVGEEVGEEVGEVRRL